MVFCVTLNRIREHIFIIESLLSIIETCHIINSQTQFYHNQYIRKVFVVYPSIPCRIMFNVDIAFYELFIRALLVWLHLKVCVARFDSTESKAFIKVQECIAFSVWWKMFIKILFPFILFWFFVSRIMGNYSFILEVDGK